MKHELTNIYRALSTGALSQQAALARIKALKRSQKVTASDCLFAGAEWEASEISTGPSSPAQGHVLLFDLPRIDAWDLQTLLSDSHCQSVPNRGADVAQSYTHFAVSAFEAIQQILKTKPQRELFVQLVVADGQNSQIFAGLSGLLRTVTLENPKVTGQIVFVPPDLSADALARVLGVERRAGADKIVRYTGDTRTRRRWRVIEDKAGTVLESESLFKEHGVYLITGGLGSLGVLVAEEIQRRTTNARIIATGRTGLTEAKQAILRRLQQRGARIEYRQLDVADSAQVEQVISTILKEYGQLNGVIHSAGVVADNFILKKTSAEFGGVLAPKVTGTLNLDLATQAIELDFFVLFSSLASCLGNVGQADYAAANGFMDEFARHRAALVSAGKRTGKTLSVSWPHWLEGGMQIDAASLEAIRQRTGLQSLRTEEGMHALHRMLAGQQSHVLALTGDQTRIRRALAGDQLLEPEPAHPAPRAVESVSDANALTQKTREFLREQLSIVLKVPAQKIDVRAPLESYGIDSRMALSLTSQLEGTFGTLAKTLFFEYLTVEELASYFLRAHAQKLAALFATSANGQAIPVSPPTPKPLTSLRRTNSKRRRLSEYVQSSKADRTDEPIAIVGLSGRYPEARDLNAFWDNLRAGKDCIVEVPKERWDWREYYSADRTEEGRHYSKWGGFIEGVDEFDPRFFNISPREARSIDPQERLFLQHAWMAIEDAGYTRASLQMPHGKHLPGQVGVYAGVMYGEYNLSGTLASIANRVSSVLNLHGPSLTLDTMCSSSLTAIHLACQDLKLRLTELAIAGGVNVSVHPNKYKMLSAGQFISSDGHCQSFGEGGDGYIPGEGVGVVVLKRLSDAERDGNPIYGVIRGSALNHGGKTNGYTVPNPQAQADVIRQALVGARVNPRHISYIEAHGTGTKLGDPIEIAALTKAFLDGAEIDSKDAGYCLIGSAKSNIGHCESAAGIAGVTKVLLQMKHRSVVPSLHSTRLNPHIEFASTPFVVNQSLQPWNPREVDGKRVPRIAGISSFGAGGANAHIIIEEYSAPAARRQASSTLIILPLSARTADALKQKALDLLAFIERQDEVDLQSLAYTLQVGREAMSERAAFVVGTVDQLIVKLQAFVNSDAASDDVYRGQAQQHEETIPEQWLADRQLAKLADSWVKGLELPWHKLLAGSQPRMMSLPSYPFARERYWIEPSPVGVVAAQASVLHPLVHANTSNIFQQSYSSTFKGTEHFLEEDAATGQKMLSAATALDMIRAALELAVPNSSEPGLWELQSTVWGERIVVTGDSAVHIVLRAHDNDAVDVEIYSEDSSGDDVVHWQSQAIFIRGAVSEGEPVMELAPARNEPLAQVAVWKEFLGTEKKPTNIALASKDEWRVPRPIRRPLVTLLDPALPQRLLGQSVVDGLTDLGDGVFCIDTGSASDLPEDADEVVDLLLRGMDKAQQQPSIKVLLVKAGEAGFWRGGRSVCNQAIERRLFSAIAAFPYPVIAVLPRDAYGAGLLLAAICDFMVCNRDGHYGYTDLRQKIFPTSSEQRFFRERLGATVANDFLYQSTLLLGRQLSAKGWACQIAPMDKVETQARALARDLADKSQTALRLLKAHLARPLVPLVDDLQIVDTNAWFSGDVSDRAMSCEIASSAANFELQTLGDDVLAITLTATDGLGRLVADLRSVFDQVNASLRYRTVVLTNGSAGLPALNKADTQALNELRRLMQGCRVPVIAAFNSNLEGAAWLLALWCDACVYQTNGQYSAHGLWSRPHLAREAAALFVQRLGTSLGQEVCLTTDGYSGLDLQTRNGALIVADSGDVVQKALQLAAFWGQWPRSVVTDWKQAQAAHHQSVVDAQLEWQAQNESADIANSVAGDATPVSLALRSNAVTASAYPDGVVVVSLQERDAKNMFTEALVNGLKEVFSHVERSLTCKVVVLTGYDSYFATGGTQETLLAIQEGQARFTDDKAFQLPMECSLPVIAAMQGHGIGAGWSFGMFADVTLYSAESRYLSPYMGYGFTPGAGATWVFPAKIGHDLARETLFTAKEISGEALKERGLPMSVLPRREVVPAAIELGRRIARQSREHLRGLKLQWTHSLRDAREDAYRHEVRMHEETFVGQADTLARIQAKFSQDNVQEPVSPPPHATPSVVADEGASIATVAAKLKSILAAELHLRVDEVDDDTQFIDLGLDSITAVTWIRNINQYYRTNIEATKVYSFPTLREISVHVREEAAKAGTLSKATPVAPAKPVVSEKPQTSPAVARPQTMSKAPSKLVSWRRQAKNARRPIAQPDVLPPQTARSEVAPSQPQAIAVIGMAGQFPQAKNIEEFWDNIAAGRNCISEVSADRWSLDTFYQSGAPAAGKTNSRWLGALEDYDRFDPLFFNISPTEAESMDPQQRLFLQACWHSIENAGYNPHRLSGRPCGVFVGCAANDYHEQSREHRLSAQGFTGSSTSILAARIAYFLNLRGPCISIDTACSSSLVAIADACDSLISGTSEVALAGGVYVMSGPALHIMTSQAGMLSTDGRCFTFDQRANGFVPGEGVGVLMLKRLADAERDGDRILGVIQGWAVNQDGKTNGITAPNEESQTRLLQDVYRRFQIDPAGIQLIEAHGTGTKLGDPIEVAGLKGAFQSFTERRDYCAVGSVKSNIGHCLTAAGAAGMIKLLQALKHRQLPPTINFSKCNEHIRLDGSPFYVNDSLRSWDVEGEETRRAAISSFGFSGTNAHIVIAEHAELERARSTQDGKVIVPLSARTAEQLQQAASDLLAWLRKYGEFIELIDAAYTLQLGRDQMDERVAFLAETQDELIEKLEAYVAGKSDIADVYQGHVKRNKEEIRLISQDEDARATLVEKWLSQKKLAQLASVWVKGLALDWNRFYGETKPLRIELPNYPFAKERYWIDATVNDSTVRDILHPLLHKNVSLLSQQRYRTEFSGEEFFVDSRIAGKKLLAPMSLLEMARAAVMHATSDLGQQVTIELDEVTWSRPCFVAERGTGLVINLSAQDVGMAYETIGFEIRYADVEGDEALIAEGLAHLHDQIPGTQVDLVSLRSAMVSEQGVGEVYRGNDQLLVHIGLPGTLDSMQRDYVLHPALMESALQACMTFVRNPDQTHDRVLLPASMTALTVSAACDARMWAWVRHAEQDGELDVDLLDVEGHSRVQIRGLVLEQYPAGDEVSATNRSGLTLMTPRWDVIASGSDTAPLRSYQTILVIGADAAQRDVLQSDFADSAIAFVNIAEADDPAAICNKLGGIQFEKLIWIAGAHDVAALTEESIIADQDRGIVQVLRIARALATLGHEKRVIDWDLITFQSLPVKPTDTVNPTHAALLGFVGSLSEAYPAWHIRLLDLEVLSEDAAIDLQQLPRQASGTCHALRGREWFGQKLIPVRELPQAEAPYRAQGVYVVIGGSGGIGEVWTRHVIERYQAKVIWIGRRAINGDIRGQIASLSQLGLEPEYIQADASNLHELTAAVESIKSRYPRIHGVVHSAVGAFDQSLKTVSEQDFRSILSVKIDLSVRIAQVFEHEALDFILFFSSNASFVRWGGMSGYSAGCTFKDTFAQQLSKLRAGVVKVVNWGYWSVGAGAAFTDAMKTFFHETGHRPLEPRAAMQALDHFLASKLDQISIAHGVGPATVQRGAEEEWVTSYENSRGPNLVRQELAALRDLDLSPAFERFTLRIGGEMEAPLTRLLRGILRATPEVIGSYERWLQESQKIVGSDAESYSTIEQLWNEWDEARREWLRDDGKRALCNLVDKCVRALPDILVGKQKATDVMFPGSSLELVESVYKTDTISQGFNDSLCDSLVAAIQARLEAEPAARITLLEIGAGTGATTTRILERLQPYESRIAEYCYTDISKTFLFHAENVYKPRAPYLRTQLFNVEQPIAQQGIAAGGYDFVIAANVIHATRNIRNTLRNAKAVLREQGMLLLNEISERSICGHVTFGLLGGWWLNEDEAIRIPGSPGLYPERWQQILRDEGFHSVIHPTKDAHALGLQIILAVSDGIVRQKGTALAVAPAERQSDRAIMPVVTATPPAPRVPTPAPRIAARDSTNIATLLRDKTLLFCRQLIGKALKIDAQQIDPTEPLESYGIDSLIVGLVNQQLQQHFDNVSSTLLYEFQSVEEIAGHLIETQRPTLERLFQLDQATANETTTPAPQPSVRSPRISLGVAGRGTKRALRSNHGRRQPIAIVGISGLYPQAPTLNAFWENLKAGKNCVTEIPAERWSLDGFYEPDEGKAVEQGKSYCKWGGFVDQFAQFDTLFFGIAPREALNMDPQERLFLQAAWSALENGGYTRQALREKLKRRVGVFAGVTRTGYNLYRPVFDADEKFWPRTSFGSVANRLSYLLDVNGPSVPVDTMCSSSLTAIHEACEHIHNGDCDLAIAGGVNLYLHPTSFIDMSSQHMLSRDGLCRSFGKGGNGFVPGEGVGVVLLKPLDRAIADQDIIHGVILATHVNHGGKTSGFTVPNPVAQAELVRAAIDKAGISARDVSYIEAHGTGTELGDPIEISGLQQAFAKDTRETGYCKIGSAKANIGHLEAAAGIAGLTKVLLQLKHGQIAPSLHASQVNPHIRFEQTPFEVNQQLIPWERPVVGGKARPRIAGISSFGAGGANAHVILQEYQPAQVRAARTANAAGGEVIVPLSARTADQLLQKARDLLDSLHTAGCDLAAIAYTLQIGREAMDERVCLVVNTIEQLTRGLGAYVNGEEDIDGVYRGRVKRNDRLSMLVQDEDIGEAIERWVARGKFSKFAQLWVQGLDFDWHKLYGESRPRRVELPTYPFAKDRYWIDSVGSPSAAAPLKGASPPPAVRNLHLIEDLIDKIDGASIDSTQGAELLRKLV